jgi:hypothetical protein
MTQILPRKAADNKLRELVKAKLNHVVQNLDMHAISLCGPVAVGGVRSRLSAWCATALGIGNCRHS